MINALARLGGLEPANCYADKSDGYRLQAKRMMALFPASAD